MRDSRPSANQGNEGLGLVRVENRGGGANSQATLPPIVFIGLLAMDVLFSISLCPTVHLEELPHPFNKVLSNYSNEVDPAPSYCQCVHIFSKSQVQSKKLNLFDYIDISPVDG